MRRAKYINYKKAEGKWWIIPTILLVYSLPFIINDDYLIYTITVIGITMIAAVGLDLVTGCAGQISIGHGAFLALGAYSYTLLGTRLGMDNMFLMIFLSGVISSVTSLILGFPALRVKGIYLALITMGFGLSLETLMIYFDSVTGGSAGLAVPEAVLGGFLFDTDVKKYYLIYCFVILATIIGRLILDSKLGRAFLSIRDSDIAAQTSGVNMVIYRNLAFILGCFYAGVAGALYAIVLNFIDPSNFTFMVSIDYLVILIIGGFGTIYGVLIGSVFIGFLMDFIKLSCQYFGMKGGGEFRIIIYGFTILVFIVFEPNGFYGRWQIIRAYWKQFPLNEVQKKRIAWIRRWK